MDEVTYLRSATRAIDLAHRALAAGLPREPHRGESWVLLALAALTARDALDDALRGVDEILADARARGSALTVVTVSSLRANIELRRGNLIASQSDAQTAIELAPDLLGGEFAGLGVAAAVLVGLEGDETPESLRRLIDGVGVRYDTEFMPNALLRYASGVLRAAAGNHAAAIEELRGCEFDHPAYGGANPAMFPWRSSAALSLAELGRRSDAQALAADEVQRAQSFGAPRAIGIALRAQALQRWRVEAGLLALAGGLPACRDRGLPRRHRPRRCRAPEPRRLRRSGLRRRRARRRICLPGRVLVGRRNRPPGGCCGARAGGLARRHRA
jgi:hypothetical protein